MTAVRSISSIIFVILILYSPNTKLFAASAINLLKLDFVKVAKPSALKGDAKKLIPLTDKNPSTSVTISLSPDGYLDILLAYGEKTVTPEKLAIQLSKNVLEKGFKGHVEVMVSTISPEIGFQSLRSEPIRNYKGLQRVTLPQAAARWILVRLLPAKEMTKIDVAELHISGHIGTPETHYEFKESPATALDVLTRLQKTVDVDISPEETRLFEDAKDGKLDDWPFAEAALLASGILDNDKRKAYLLKIDKLEAKAKKAVEGANGQFEKGEKLLKWLHKGIMAKGYIEGQTNVSALLDTGNYNCVSSAAIFNILAKRLGLDARAIEVPTHAFAIVYDGTKHADVETTTAGGFNPSRDPASIITFEKKTGFKYIPDKYRSKRREINEAGLAAIIYYNRGVKLTENKNYHKALLSYFRALSLDPEFASSIKNVLAVLGSWSFDLSEEKKFEKSLEVIGVGLALAPKDWKLLHNQKAIWSSWAKSAIDAGNTDEALAILKKAHTAVPKGGFLRQQTWIFLRQGEDLIKAGNWEKALALVGTALEKVDPAVRGEILKWQVGVHIRWGNKEIKAGNFEKASEILGRAMSLEKKDWRIKNNLGYLTQEWGNAVYKNEGAEKAGEILLRLREKYPTVRKVNRSAEQYAYKRVSELYNANKYQEALKAVKQYKNLFQNDRNYLKAVNPVYDAWAKKSMDNGQWKEAAMIYGKGLKQYPNNAHLKHNASVCWDRQAHYFSKEKDWKGALKVYEDALQIIPGSPILKNNALAVWDTWAKTYISTQKWNKAIKVYKKGLNQFPNNYIMKKNIRYCEQQMNKK